MKCYIKTLTFISALRNARVLLSKAVTVLFPTPPFPDKIRILFLTSPNLFFTSSIPGSGPFVTPEAHICLLGHPSQADAFPAVSLCVPGQSV